MLKNTDLEYLAVLESSKIRCKCRFDHVTPHVANQKSERISVPLVLNEMIETIIRVHGHRPKLVLSPQPLIDSGMYHNYKQIKEFCCNPDFGFESEETYPFIRMKRDEWDAMDYKAREYERYFLNELDYVDGEVYMKAALCENFKDDGPKYPIYAGMNMMQFKNPEVARKAATEMPYEHPKCKKSMTKSKKKALKPDYHALLIVGIDTMDPNDSFLWVKSTYGGMWGLNGLSRIRFSVLEHLYVPTYNHDEIMKLKKDVKRKNLEARATRPPNSHSLDAPIPIICGEDVGHPNEPSLVENRGTMECKSSVSEKKFVYTISNVVSFSNNDNKVQTLDDAEGARKHNIM